MGKKIAIAAGVVLLVLVAGAVWFYVSSGSGEPSAEVTAPTIARPAVTDSVVDTTQVESLGQVTYDIDKTQSSVRFEIDEILRGNPKHVVGMTSEVAGQVLIDFDNPANSQIGTIVINVRTFKTDSDLRDRSIRGPILDSSSDENEFSEFAPTSIEGLPTTVAVGDVVNLTVVGELLLSGTTSTVTFDVTVTVVSVDQIAVAGSADVLRSDFGLTIPNVAAVAAVTNEVLLVFDFIATAG